MTDGGRESPLSCREDPDWYKGQLTVLPLVTGNLASWAMAHPAAYARPTAPRLAAFAEMFRALLRAVDAARIGDAADWCDVLRRASAASYEILRFYDTGTERYFLYGRDPAREQAYFFINPEARRNIVLEAPHDGDPGSHRGTLRMFVSDLAPRAAIFSGSSCCAATESSRCAGETAECQGIGFPSSDMAHAVDSFFHEVHKVMDDRPLSIDRNHGTVTRFVQNHTANGDLSS